MSARTAWPGREPQHVLERRQLVGAVRRPARRGQREVEQDAVDVVGEQPLGLGEVAGGADPDRLAGRVEQFGHGEGARRVVLDDQEGQLRSVPASGVSAGAVLAGPRSRRRGRVSTA